MDKHDPDAGRRITGSVKEAIGTITGDSRLQTEGAAEKTQKSSAGQTKPKG